MSKQTFNPYVGLRPFDVDENLLFFGRDEQTLEILQRLHENHFVAVVGGSGSGKSSIIRAGLIPALKGGYLVEDSNKWIISIMKPGQNPMNNLARAILQQVNPDATGTDIEGLVKALKREGVAAIVKLFEPIKKEQNANFFLLVDQFEELFRFALEQRDSEKITETIDFVNILLKLSKQNVISFFVVITMRSDFIGDCARFYDLPQALNKSQYLVPRLNRRQLKMVIESPAKLFGGKLNPILTTRLLNELGKVKDELPLLQHALMRMWEFEMDVDKNGELDLNDYQKIGGIEKALSKHADEALDGMSAEDLLLTKHIFQALTSIDENGRKVRRPVLLSQLKELTGAKEEKLLDIIDRFIEEKRSFLMVNKAGANDKVIDISHESLIRQWKTLSEWVDEEDKSATIYLQLNEAVKLHQEGKKDFLTGSELQFALDWYDKFNPAAPWANRYKKGFEESVEYLYESKKERSSLVLTKKRQKRKRLILNSTISGLFIFLVLVTFSYINSKKLNQEIRLQQSVSDSLANVAQTQRLVAEEKSKNAIRQKNKADSTAIIASQQRIIAEVRTKEMIRQKIKADSIAIVASEQRILAEERTKEVIRLKNKSDSTAIVASQQRTLAEERTKEAILQKKRADSAVIIAKEQMNKAQANYLISSAYRNVNNDPTLALNLAIEAMSLPGYDTFKKDALKIYRENSFYKIVAKHQLRINSIAFSPDGNSILIGSEDSTVYLVDLKGKKIGEFNHSSSVSSVTFSPDGKTILTGSFDRTARLWDLKGNKVAAFDHRRPVLSVAFSPDGKKILTSSDDGYARLWNLKGKELKQFIGSSYRINSVSFSPDGKWILVGYKNKKPSLWNIKGNMIAEFDHRSSVISLAFSPNGKNIITSSEDGYAFLWNLNGKMLKSFRLYGGSGVINSITFSPDGRKILTGSSDKIARLWNLNGEMIREFSGHTSLINLVAFSPDGKSILTSSNDGTLRLWKLKGLIFQEFFSHSGHIVSLAYSPDGKTILSGDDYGKAHLWNLNGGLIQEFIGHSGSIRSVAFSPDGRYILTGSGDKTARLWTVNGEILKEFNVEFVDFEKVELIDEYSDDYYGVINSVAFSPDGQSIITGSDDLTARLWNLNGDLIQEFIGHSSIVYSVAFSPDGQSFITGSEDFTARLWNLNSGFIQEFIGHSSAVFSVAFSSDGKKILTGSDDNTAILWNVEGKIIQYFRGKGQSDFVSAVNFSPDNKTILTTFEASVCVWNLNGWIIQEINDDYLIGATAFSPDGKSIVIGGDKGIIQIWDVAMTLEDYLKSGWLEPLTKEQKKEFGIE